MELQDERSTHLCQFCSSHLTHSLTHPFVINLVPVISLTYSITHSFFINFAPVISLTHSPLCYQFCSSHLTNTHTPFLTAPSSPFHTPFSHTHTHTYTHTHPPFSHSAVLTKDSDFMVYGIPKIVLVGEAVVDVSTVTFQVSHCVQQSNR